MALQHLSSSPRRAVRGFTLIELMVTVAVIAILSMIAYPSYTDYLRRGQVQEAPTNLATFRAQMELYYQDNRNYGTGTTCGAALPVASASTHFTYACTLSNSNQSYSATATGSSGLVVGLVYAVDETNAQKTTCNNCAWNFSTTQNTWVLRRP